jgi:hypothetical protein
MLWPIATSANPMIAADISSSAAPTPNTSRRMFHNRLNDSSRPIENNSRMMPSSAKGAMALGFEIVT